MQRIILSLRLIFLGKRLEQAREQLTRLHLAGEPNDSPRMRRSRRHFNCLCNKWSKLAGVYEEYRK